MDPEEEKKWMDIIYGALAKASEDKYTRRKKVFNILRTIMKEEYNVDLCELLAKTFYSGLEKRLLPCLRDRDIDQIRTIYNKVIWCLARLVYYCGAPSVKDVRDLRGEEEIKELLMQSLQRFEGGRVRRREEHKKRSEQEES